MDIKDYLVLQTLITERSLSKTAKLMNMSQPGVTLRLNKIRNELKDQILVRNGHNMELTAKAHAILSTLQQINHEFVAILPNLQQFDPYKTPAQFTIHVIEIAYDVIAERLINEIQRYNKDHVISLQIFQGVYNYEYVHQFDKADVIIGFYEHLSNFGVKVIAEDGFVLAYDRYPLTQKAIDYETYINLPHVAHSISSDDNLFVQTYLGIPDPRNIKLRCARIDRIVSLLKDRYVATLPLNYALYKGLNVVPLPFETAKVPVTLAYPKRLEHNVQNRWLRELCERVCLECINAL
ncbi:MULTISPECIES: LysR family transcriptional regulator [Cysteiniphilum]|uniref:Nodulation protein D 2 n=1 Tax=Cysteiniphilum litorale TaxID=2056700 RepID=A0A8J2Z291_9GAMM|nr:MULTISPECIES: LysR family transcriptional regulator [Cysteiniphilum]GGF88410.1 nodulation protein D 2 [Cysteiniphilum litorale]